MGHRSHFHGVTIAAILGLSAVVVYAALLKAKASGLNFVDGGFFYEGVRLCQSEPDATGDCWR